MTPYRPAGLTSPRPVAGPELTAGPTGPGAGAGAPRAENGAVSQRSASEYPTLLQRVPAILYTADPGAIARWHYVSPQIEAILGFSPEEWCADPARWLNQLHPDDRERMIAMEAGEVSGQAPYGAAEYRLLHRDGHVVWVCDDARLLESEAGSVRWHGVMSDVTDRKLAEAELERRIAQQAAVARLGEHALEGASTSDLMQEAVTTVTQQLGVEIAAVIELRPDRRAFEVRAFTGLPETASNATIPSGNRTQAGYTIVTGAPVIVSDWNHEHRLTRSQTLTTAGVCSGLTVVIEGRRAPFGVLGAHSASIRAFQTRDVDFVQAIANVLGDAFERQLTDDDIRHRTLHDHLTGLPNRELFMDRLQHATERLRRRRGLTAVLSLDLDRFKLINDSLGHKLGDDLLTEAAPRLKQVVAPSDTVARFGGDEFGILLEEVADERAAVQMAQRIAAALTGPFVLGGNEHFVSTSIGIALASGGEPADDLIRDADAALNRAKERGRARYELFDEALRSRSISRRQVENDLRRAIERDELTLEYQPMVSLRDQSIVGVEALIRWEHPERGRTQPGDFIPVAEENGLIEPIARWVLERACRQAARWHQERPDAVPISMSVNLSGVQIGNPSLADTVAAALSTSGLDPSCLTLEITESVLLGDTENLTAAMAGLKALGVRLVLDDFGTGYSSLAYLTRLPLDALKVDRSFVDGLGTEPRDTTITEAIVAMSHALSLDVVGEGAQTALQIAELTRLGCDFAQGFYFSRPVNADQIERMLVSGPPWLAVRSQKNAQG